jgi:alpha-tubulin suppressor-like RCC1 family protein
VGAVTVTPVLGRASTRFTVAYQVSEPLAADPVVRLDVGGGRLAPLAVDDVGTDRAALRYVSSYTAQGTEEQGARALTVDLLDHSGAVATGLPAGVLLLDFTPPETSPLAPPQPGWASSGVTVTTRLSVAEEPATAPEVLLFRDDDPVPDAWARWSVTAAEGAWTATLVPGGDEEEGTYSVRARARDAAGNQGGWVVLGPLRLDFTPPALDPGVTPRVSPPVAGVAQVVSVEVRLDDEVRPGATLRARAPGHDLAFQPAESTGRVLSFVRDTAPGDEGTYTITLAGLTDLAGNVAPDLVVGTLTVDGTPPHLEPVTLAGAPWNAAATLGVTLVVSEPLREPPVVLLGGVQVPLVESDPPRFWHALPLAPTTLSGRLPLTVNLVDVVGNRVVVQAAQVEVDAAPPTLVETRFSPDGVVGLGQRVTLVLGVSETLAEPPSLAWESPPGPPPLAPLACDATACTATLDVTRDTVGGVFRLAGVRLQDLAGNPAQVPLDVVLEVDVVPPVVQDMAASPARVSRQPGHNEVSLTLAVSEPLDVPPAGLVARVGPQPLPCARVGLVRYTCRTLLGGQVPSGTAVVEVAATDRAGNVGIATTTVQVDLSPPAVVAAAVSPSLARRGAQVVVTLSADEELGEPPALQVRTPQGDPWVMDPVPGARWAWRRTVTAADDSGAYSLATTLQDPVGNPSGVLVLPPFTVDASPPVVQGLSSAWPAYGPAGDRDVVTIRFQAQDAEGGAVTVAARLGTWPLACVEETAGAYLCQRPLTGAEPDGSYAVTAWATDQAGNVGSASLVVQVDGAPPGVVAVVVSPSLVGLGQVLRVTVTTDEELASTSAVWLDGPVRADLGPVPGVRYAFQAQVTSALPDGDYVVRAHLGDPQGNATEVVLGHARVDVTPPDLHGLAPSAPAYSRQPGHDVVVVTFDGPAETGEAPAGLEVVAGSTPMTCLPRQPASPHHTCTLPVDAETGEGTLAVLVSGWDAAGNRASLSTTVRLDYTPPAVVTGTVVLEVEPPPTAWRANPSRATVGSRVRLRYVVDEPLGRVPVARAVAPAAWVVAPAGGHGQEYVHVQEITGAHVVEGTYQLVVDVVDAVGNHATYALVVPPPGLVVDVTPPSVTLDTHPPAVTTARSATFRFHASEEEEFRCALDGASPAPCGTPVVVDDREDGDHTLEVWAQDGAGNTSQPVSWTWRVDNQAPVVAVTGQPDSPTRLRDATLDLACSEDGCLFQCALDGQPEQPCGSPLNLPGLAPGDHVVEVRAVDPAGNAGEVTTVAWHVLADWVAVGTGERHTCALADDQGLWCWGKNDRGQLGVGDGNGRGRPTRVGSSRWRFLAVGWRANCAVREEGSLWCWGANDRGQLGDGTPLDRRAPVRVGQDDNWDAVAVGLSHSCGLQQGRLSCWGSNDAGQLGAVVPPGGTAEPVVVGGLSDWTHVAAGGDTTCATRAPGTLWCWGQGADGQLGVGSFSITEASPRQVGPATTWRQVTLSPQHACATRTDGSLWCWGNNDAGQLGLDSTTAQAEPVQVGADTTWITVSVGRRLSCASRGEGSGWCWGGNPNGQLGDGTRTGRLVPTPVVGSRAWRHLSPGEHHACGVGQDGDLACWGLASFGGLGDGNLGVQSSPVLVDDTHPWLQGSMGDSFACAVRGDRTLWCWGNNLDGQLGKGDQVGTDRPAQVGTQSDWLSVSCGGYHTCGRRAGGSLWCWGWHGHGSLGVGSVSSQQVDPERVGTEAWDAVSAGRYHTCGLQADGSLWCWGSFKNGRLGVGTVDANQLTPVRVGGDAWLSVAAGQYHSCGVRADGRALCWGYNGNGQGGWDGPEVETWSPALVSGGILDWHAVSAGAWNSCGVTASGATLCWGFNARGQLGRGDISVVSGPQVTQAGEPLSSLGIGTHHVCGLRASGQALCWGSGEAGQLGLGPDVLGQLVPAAVPFPTAWVSLDAGSNSSVGVTREGGLWTWGTDDFGQLGLGTFWVPAPAELPRP